MRAKCAYRFVLLMIFVVSLVVLVVLVCISALVCSGRILCLSGAEFCAAFYGGGSSLVKIRRVDLLWLRRAIPGVCAGDRGSRFFS